MERETREGVEQDGSRVINGIDSEEHWGVVLKLCSWIHEEPMPVGAAAGAWLQNSSAGCTNNPSHNLLYSILVS